VLANWAVSGALAWSLSPLHRKPVVTVLRGSDAVVKGGQIVSSSPLLKFALKGSKAVVCVGKELEKSIKAISHHPEKVGHIPNGICEHFFLVDLPEPAPTMNIIFAGSLVPDKGVDVLLKAVERLKNLNLHLIIAGQGPLERELKELTQRLKIEHLVTFEGQVPPGRPMAEMMSRAHFLVLPSRHEGRSNVILEAMAAGRPVIGTDTQGIRELVKDSETGFLFPDGDISGLSRAMEKLTQDPGRLTRMGRSARQWVLDQGLTWENTARQYVQLFRKAMVSEPHKLRPR